MTNWISRKCEYCNQPLEDISVDLDDSPQFRFHENVFDCLKALIRRVEDLEAEILAIRLPEGLSRSSEPGPTSGNPTPVIIPGLPSKKITL